MYVQYVYDIMRVRNAILFETMSTNDLVLHNSSKTHVCTGQYL